MGAALGVSPQRVSQLQNPRCGDLPTLMQVAKLEGWIGEPIVSDGLANIVKATARHGDLDLGRETREATYAAVDLQRGVDDGLGREHLQALAQRLQRELNDVTGLLVGAPP